MRWLAYCPRPQLPLALLLLFGVAEGCASISSKDDAPLPLGNLGDSGHGPVSVVEGGTLDGGHSRVPTLNPLCGVGSCLKSSPDDPTACAKYPGTGGAPGKDSGPPRGTGGGGSSLDAGADAMLPEGSTPDANTPVSDAGDASIGPPIRQDAHPTYTETPEIDAGALYSCQVHPVDNGAPVHGCVRAGAGDVGSACTGAIDCRAGLACVGQAPSDAGGVGAGQCQKYCCNEGGVCQPRPRADGGFTPTFCSPQPLIEGRDATKLMVPVCVSAEGCFLGQKNGCEGDPDKTCAVVKADGTTGCVTPGKGQVGDPCVAQSRSSGDPDHSCAAGYFCSAANLCIKICQPGVTDALCEPGKCQATGWNNGFGLCVGARPALK
jgi:hypothetical protein